MSKVKYEKISLHADTVSMGNMRTIIRWSVARQQRALNFPETRMIYAGTSVNINGTGLWSLYSDSVIDYMRVFFLFY